MFRENTCRKIVRSPFFSNSAKAKLLMGTLFLAIVLLGFFLLLWAMSSMQRGQYVAKKTIPISGIVATPHVSREGDYKLEIIMPGPDGRYNPGVRMFRSSDIAYLVTSLSTAVGKIRELPGGHAQIDFEIPINKDIAVCVKSSVGSVKLMTRSSTRVFWRMYSLTESLSLIETLQSLPEVAQSVSDQYRRLQGGYGRPLFPGIVRRVLARRGQVHVFGQAFLGKTRFLAEKWTSPRTLQFSCGTATLAFKKACGGL